jgi:hypothetical protein
MKFKQFLSENQNLATFNGKPFWAGAVNLFSGDIEEIHSYQEAENNDFHHSMYFSQNATERMKDEEYGFFWLTIKNNQLIVNGDWRTKIPQNILNKIKSQIKPI